MRLTDRARASSLRFAAIAACTLLCLAGSVSMARAELVFFSTGRTMSVRSHRQDGDTLIFSLRSGGEMAVEQALVTEIRPDEVPYPEPQSPPDLAPLPSSPPRARTLAVNPTFDPIIERLSAEKGVDARLVRAVIQVESGYQPRARSSKGAVGLMQVMPATARQYGITNLYDPSSNIRAGVTHLKALLDRFPLALALAAYNAGEAAVERFAGIPPYPETIDYVTRIRALVGR
jgi:soluble lytic murein transglycosylase-like protein